MSFDLDGSYVAFSICHNVFNEYGSISENVGVLTFHIKDAAQHQTA